MGTSPTPAPPCDPRVARSRAKLLAAATEILIETGPSSVTVDAVAERSGVAKSTLYRHWESRSALLVDVLRTHRPEVSEPRLDLGFEAALRQQIDHLATQLSDSEWGRTLPALFALTQQFPEVADLEECDREEKMASVRTILDLGVAEGRIAPGYDPTLMMTTLVGPIMMCALIRQSDRAHEVAHAALDAFFALHPPRG